MIYKCECGRSLPIDIPGKFRCACGLSKVICGPVNKDAYGTRKPASWSIPCIHRSDAIGTAECDCRTKPAVYNCNLKDGLCVDRKQTTVAMLVQIGDNKPKAMCVHSCRNCPQQIKTLPTIYTSSAAIITTHYNPAGFTRLRETWREWQPTVGDVITMELVIDGEPEIPGSVAIRGTGDNALWQKERLINLAIERLPSEVRTVAWVDHDIVFENPNWLVESQRLIDDGVDCVQPFSLIKYQGRTGKVDRTARGAASVSLTGGTPDTGPGAAWVASREWLRSIGGLYDQNIVGGGDAVFFEAVSKQRTKYRERQSDASQRHLGRWIETVGPVRYGCLPGAVRHLWHGDVGNRQYVSRDAILRQFEYDPMRHIEIDANGLLAWTVAASPEFREAVAGYFVGRREDG